MVRGKRAGMSKVVATAILLVITLAAVAGGAIYIITSSSSPVARSTTSAGDIVIARMVYPNGTGAVNGTLKLGQELLLSVEVPDSAKPVAVHQVYDNRVYGSFDWNVTATHYNYVIDSGPADTSDLGVNRMYAVVVFADGTAARSNNVTIVVVP